MLRNSNPDYTQNVSLRLSSVLDEIGVNETIVVKRRRLYLLQECVDSLTCQLMDNDSSVYYLGSQTESTTTPGLVSDADCLISLNLINVIQDWSEWERGVTNLLMIQDDTVSPGYCLLQRVKRDVPLPYNKVENEDYFKDNKGRILLRNTVISKQDALEGMLRHGPAQVLQGVPGTRDIDNVFALPCKSWPKQASQWLAQERLSAWPTADMRRYCKSTGCFVVAVGGKCSENEELEWRISTSLAERCLMFNLNITQIRCYVLMKMILKTFINPQFPDSISSFMCKTVLLHSIENTQTNSWRETNLLTCLTFCLSTLYNCVLREFCPHFIIPENNLLSERISLESKPLILEKLKYVIDSNGRALLEVRCDSFGFLLAINNNGMLGRIPQIKSTRISGHLFKETVLHVNVCSNILQSNLNDTFQTHAVEHVLTTSMFKLLYKHLSSQGLYKVACSLLAHQLCKTLGYVLASLNINLYNCVTLETLTWLLLGLNSDVSSSKLKLATIFYVVEEIETAEMILKNTEECYDRNVVEPVCACYSFKHKDRRKAFDRASFQQNNEHTLVRHIAASCVIFLPSEMNCCPREFQHEMLRSTQADLPCRVEEDFWMDWAVVDSLPYLYFLQYKIYGHLGRHNDKQIALSNLAKAIDEEPNFGHRETALNLLGQCMEQENRDIDALKCYQLSLQLRRRNNAAKELIGRLLARL